MEDARDIIHPLGGFEEVSGSRLRVMLRPNSAGNRWQSRPMRPDRIIHHVQREYRANDGLGRTDAWRDKFAARRNPKC